MSANQGPDNGWGSSRLEGEPSGAEGSSSAERMFRTVPPREMASPPGGSWRGTLTALRAILRERRRLLLSLLAVSLGVGYLAGSLSLLQRVGAGLAAQAGEGAERADLVVEGAIASDTPLQQLRRLVPESALAQIAMVPGVASAEPRLEYLSALILTPDGKPVVRLGLTERPMGANFPSDPLLNPYEFVGDGRPPSTATEVVIDEGSAKATGLRVGEKVRIAGKTVVSEYTITGIVRLRSGTLPAGSSLALFTTPTARTLFDSPNDDNAIAIRVADGASVDEVQQRIKSILPPLTEIADGETYTQHRLDTFGRSFALIRYLLIGFAALAVVVGSFTVANSMTLVFETRRRSFASLRLVGASPSQLMAAATLEAIIGGLVAGAVGTIIGLGIGWAIERIIVAMGTALPVAGPALTWWIPLVALAVGALVTAAASLAPARRAAHTAPVHAITDHLVDSERSTRRTLARGLVWLLVMAAIGGIGAQIFGATAAIPVAAGVGAAVALVLVLLPMALSRVVSSFAQVLVGKSVALRRMTKLRSASSRHRTASTTAALLLATAVVTALTVVATSFVGSIDDQFRDAVKADLIIDSRTLTNGGLSADLIPVLRGIQGVKAVSGWRAATLSLAGYQFRAGGMSGKDMFSLVDLDFTSPPPKELSPNGVAISETAAELLGASVGSQVPAYWESGLSETLRVDAIYRSGLRTVLGDAIVDTERVQTNLARSIDAVAFVGLVRHNDSATIAAISAAAKAYGGPDVLRPDQLVSARTEMLRGFARVIQWMLLFSVLLALLGVANTLQLGVNERRREFGLLRAVGAQPEQILSMVMSEAVALSIIGTVFGVLIGTGAAYATVSSLRDLGLDRFVAPVGVLVAIALVALALGMASAVVPAIRAARMSVLGLMDEQNSPRRQRRARKPLDESVRSRSLATAVSDDASQPASTATTDPRQSEIDDTENAGEIMRCYNCGQEPGDGDTCQSCGASQLPAPVGMFAVGPNTERPQHQAPELEEPPVEPEFTDAWTPDVLWEANNASTAPTAGMWSTGAADTETESTSPAEPPKVVRYAAGGDEPEILDAAVVDEDDEVLAEVDSRFTQSSPRVDAAAPRQEPGESTAPHIPIRGADTAQSPYGGATLGSIFAAQDSQPATGGLSAEPVLEQGPTRLGAAHESPFGRDANPEEPKPEPEPIQQPEWAPESIFSAGEPTADTIPDPAAATAAKSETAFSFLSAQRPGVTPPAFTNPEGQSQRGSFAPPQVAPAAAAAPAAAPASAPVVEPDEHGLAAAIARLATASQQHGSLAFCICGALLGSDEVVLGAVAGSSLGMATVAVVTPRRVLVVSDRRYVPDVEQFMLGPGLIVHGRAANGQASLTFADDERLVSIDQIADVSVAVEVANAARNPGTSHEF